MLIGLKTSLSKDNKDIVWCRLIGFPMSSYAIVGLGGSGNRKIRVTSPLFLWMRSCVRIRQPFLRTFLTVFSNSLDFKLQQVLIGFTN